MMIENKVSLKLSDIEKMNISPGDDVEYELDKDQMKQLDPETKEILVRDKVRRSVRKMGEDGLSISEIIKLTGFDRKTVVGHLRVLESLREVYSQRKNGKLILYYPNGKPLHNLGKKRIEYGGSVLEISIAQGQKKKLFFYILEKKYTIIDGEVSEGAILLPLDNLDEFVEALRTFRLEFQEVTL
jgi:predicted transcriptional regulator